MPRDIRDTKGFDSSEPDACRYTTGPFAKSLLPDSDNEEIWPHALWNPTEPQEIDTSYTKKDFMCEYVLTKESSVMGLGVEALSLVEEAEAVWDEIEKRCNETE